MLCTQTSFIFTKIAIKFVLWCLRSVFKFCGKFLFCVFEFALFRYKEGRELEQLPAQLEALENEQQAIAAKMAAADYHASGAEGIRADRERLAEIERLLEDKFLRWAELDARASQSRNS